jgi:hypothetical protein
MTKELERKIYEALGVTPNTGGPVPVPTPIEVDEDGVVIEAEAEERKAA